MSRINQNRDGALPFVFLTCNIGRQKAIEVFGSPGTKLFKINEETFEVAYDQSSITAPGAEAKASPYLQEMLQASQIPLDPFIIERACSIVTNLQKEKEESTRPKKIKALAVLQNHLNEVFN